MEATKERNSTENESEDEISLPPVYEDIENSQIEEHHEFQETIASKWMAKLYPLLWILLNSVIVILAVALIMLQDGKRAMLGCRIIGIIGAIFMLATSGRMVWIFFKGRTHNNFHAKKQLPIMIGFFILFMTLIALYGHYSKFTKLRIFWNFDFVLHYNYRDLELALDIFYILCVIPFLIIQSLYLLFVARVYGSSDNWFFCSTLFINALQNWLLDSTIVHTEMCEKLSQYEDLVCYKYIHYQTSIENLTDPQKELYYSIKDNEAFTYTVNMELLIAYIGLLMFFAHRRHHHETLQQREDEIKPKTWYAKTILTFCFIVLFTIPLYIIYVIPIIEVTKQNFWIRCSQSIARLLVHSSNFVLIAYVSWFLFKQNLKPHWPSEADIMILWAAWIVSFIRLNANTITQIIFLYPNLNDIELITLIVADVSNFFETIAFYLLIFLVEHFLLIAENSSNINTQPYLSSFALTFLPLYFCVALLGFTAYYIVNTFHYFPQNVHNTFGLNLLVLFESSYPTTILFTMTVCLCFASTMETLFQNGYYRFQITNIANE